jgi:hypothetical protein
VRVADGASERLTEQLAADQLGQQRRDGVADATIAVRERLRKLVPVRERS